MNVPPVLIHFIYEGFKTGLPEYDGYLGDMKGEAGSTTLLSPPQLMK